MEPEAWEQGQGYEIKPSALQGGNQALEATPSHRARSPELILPRPTRLEEAALQCRGVSPWSSRGPSSAVGLLDSPQFCSCILAVLQEGRHALLSTP